MTNPETDPSKAEAIAKSPIELGPSGLAIERLEELDMPPSTKVDALLVALGEKPATLHTFRSSTTLVGEEPGELDEAEYAAYMDAVNATGMLIEVGADAIVDPDEEILKGTEGALWVNPDNASQTKATIPKHQQTRRTVFMAKTPEDLALIKEAYVNNDFRLFGQAYGFPATSTEAYAQGNAISPDTLEGQDPAVLAFAEFGLSPDNWQEELKTAERWAEATKVASPKLYEEKIRTHDPHANDEYYKAKELVEKARETKLKALALALHAGLIEAAGLTSDLAEARKNELDLPPIPASAEAATLATIQDLNHEAEDLFGQGQAIREKISRNSPKSAEEAAAGDRSK